ncbi:MAG TPA: 4Fe-4S dicluster domain-containing protein [Actinospica sp.]|nr:4Fe-4S dicluster domain-containing protein [Actinospica sp.]
MAGSASLLSAAGIGRLVAELRRRGYRVIGPVARDGAIVLDEVRDADALPWGVGIESGEGRYRLTERADRQAFANCVGPQSWKRFLLPPREKVLDADRDSEGRMTFTEPDANDEAPLALLGLRPCDLRALAILDRVLLAPGAAGAYAVRRARAFLIVVECTEPAATCFCGSAGGGPGLAADSRDAELRYDLKLTEVVGEDGEVGYVARTGSCLGASVFGAVGHERADDRTVTRAQAAVAAAADRMGRSLPSVDLRALLADSANARHWSDVAERCVACGNCTLVCPTCFCTTTEESSDLTGEHAERWMSWDSCFDLDFSYINGGEIRSSASSRYRQWLTHKFGTWHDQFGSSGCVGCGRCIAWCPAGIDPTAELGSLRQEREQEVRA